MKIKRFLLGVLAVVIAWASTSADTMDSENYPLLYLRGTMTDGWSVKEDFRLTRTGDTYSRHFDSLDGQFKIASDNWNYNYGAATTTSNDYYEINNASTFKVLQGGRNIFANSLTDVTITVTVKRDNNGNFTETYFKVSANGNPAPPIPGEGGGEDGDDTSDVKPSGTLPVLYINVYTDTLKTTLNNEIIDRNLAHKNYFKSADYWLDLNGCQWLADAGAMSLGSEEAPLPLEIKARGNFTRKGFSKKPFKLKLGAKQPMLGLSKSKHFALIAHADDEFGYLRNFTGFNLGRRIGLPWTPWQQPVEVVINGDYRGLYFLTESIRVGDGRVPVEELDDNVSDPALASGGYIIELDNYDEDASAQIQMPEKSCVSGHFIDKLRVTFDTPEEYSELQRRFINDQFTAMNDAVGAANRSDELWKYLDLDDAARYYLVEEIISHWEAYHGSTYLFRDRGDGQKWHFSPLWDCGNAFAGSTSNFFYNCDQFGNTWIPSIRENATFNQKVRDTWAWFMNNGYKGIENDIREYVDHIRAAAVSDHERWKDAPLPTNNEDVRPVVDNSNMDKPMNDVLNHLSAKTGWLKSQFGDYTQNTSVPEPARDQTEAAPLPDYMTGAPIDPDDTKYPVLYIRGTMTSNWAALPEYRLTRDGSVYSITLHDFEGQFKISDDNWGTEYGSTKGTDGEESISKNCTVEGKLHGRNFATAGNIPEVTIRFEYNAAAPGNISISFTIPREPATGMSGTLPVLYINVYTDANRDALNDEIIDRNLDHKNYFSNAEYWLDLNGCEWLAAEGAESIGSEDAPLPLEIKARGNYTRKGFSKKPFKLKLGTKQTMLGLTKSKHFALLAHADDEFGYQRNFTGFYLGKQIGLPWTPWQQPVEVVINGDYRGLYFLTESIRIDKDRINITELDDLVDTPALVSGGYLVELDNYEETNQTKMPEKSCLGNTYRDLWITWDTPEDYSETQKQFISDQFSAMNNGVGAANRSDELWEYMDLDDAVRYYLVEEIISHYEAYHGSTYLFRDRGEGEKWHFSPLWDCGHAFDGQTDNFFYNYPLSYGNTWIQSIRENAKFNAKLRDTWTWFMNNGYTGLQDAMRNYAAHIKAAAVSDRARWKDEPTPDNNGTEVSRVVDNSDMDSRLNAAISHLTAKVEWLKGQFGDFTQTPAAAEPERDTTPAAPLPSYANPDTKQITLFFLDNLSNPWSQAYAYAYDNTKNPVVKHLGDWPGTAMERVVSTYAMANVPTVEEPTCWMITFTPKTEVNDNHKIIFNNDNGDQTTDKGLPLQHWLLYRRDNTVTGLDNINVGTEVTESYYNLQGIRVDTPRKGETYIRVRGSQSAKVRF